MRPTEATVRIGRIHPTDPIPHIVQVPASAPIHNPQAHRLIASQHPGFIRWETIEPKTGTVDHAHFDDLKHKISQSLADYKLREMILTETKDIRNILYIKAFANNDAFEEYNLDF